MPHLSDHLPTLLEIGPRVRAAEIALLTEAKDSPFSFGPELRALDAARREALIAVLRLSEAVQDMADDIVEGELEEDWSVLEETVKEAERLLTRDAPEAILGNAAPVLAELRWGDSIEDVTAALGNYMAAVRAIARAEEEEAAEWRREVTAESQR